MVAFLSGLHPPRRIRGGGLDYPDAVGNNVTRQGVFESRRALLTAPNRVNIRYLRNTLLILVAAGAMTRDLLAGSFMGHALARLRQRALKFSTLLRAMNKTGVGLPFCSVILTRGYKVLR